MTMGFCSLASGSNGNCQFIEANQTKLLLDAGMSGKYIREALENQNIDINGIDGILLTHEHSDHIKGVGIIMRRHKIPIYVTEETWKITKKKVGEVDENLVNIIEKPEKFSIGDIEITSTKVNHDAIDPRCYSFSYEDIKICIATDLGIVNEEVIDTFKDCDLLMIESNHEVEMLKAGKYPYYLKQRILSEDGHLSNDAAGYVAKEVIKYGRVKNILLAHLSKDNNTPELAYETVKNILVDHGVDIYKDINLELTYRGKVGKFYKISDEFKY